MSIRRAAHLVIVLSLLAAALDGLQALLEQARSHGRAVQSRQHRLREGSEFDIPGWLCPQRKDLQGLHEGTGMGPRPENGSSWRGLVQRDRELGLTRVHGRCPAFANAPGWDVQLTAYAARDGRANLFPVGIAHSVVGGSAWEPTPWRAVQRAAWQTLTQVAA
jgi:hypothetical protein